MGSLTSTKWPHSIAPKGRFIVSLKPFSLTKLTSPGPRPIDELYQLFSQAYIAECGKIDDVAVMIGRMFIEALEREQLVKDQGK